MANFMKNLRDKARRRALTLLELLAVVLILGILSTIATNVFTGQINRARIAATRDMIREIEVAAARYEIDIGQFPPSGTATVTASGGAVSIGVEEAQGNGLLYLALVHSLNGDANVPLSPLWQGPYLNIPADKLQGSAELGRTQILDSYLQPFQYVRSDDYARAPFAGTQMFNNNKPLRTQPELPDPNPFFATETFYNPTTFQIYSFGENGTTIPQFPGTEIDDVNNFGY